MFKFLKKEEKEEPPTPDHKEGEVSKEDIKKVVEGKDSLEISSPLPQPQPREEMPHIEEHPPKDVGKGKPEEMSRSLPVPTSPHQQEIHNPLPSPHKEPPKEKDIKLDAIEQEEKKLEELFAPPSLPQSASPSLREEKPAVEEEKEQKIAVGPNYPVFISMKKYKEMIEEINTIKLSLRTMEQVTRQLNQIREEDNKVLDTTLGELEEINSRIKQISQSFKV